MESENFLIHSRYQNFINYMNETNQSELSAFDNWIKKETQVIERKKENNIRSSKIECVFCFKEVARQNISFHYDSCSGAQFFNYMQGGIFKVRHSCLKCGKNFLKKHRNRHSCDVKKKDAYVTCKYCGFNFLYHKKCRVHDIVLAYNRFNKIIEVDDSDEERSEKFHDRREDITQDLGSKVSLAACSALINSVGDEVFSEVKSIYSKSYNTESNEEDIKMFYADSETAKNLKIVIKKDSLYMENFECHDELKEMIENEEENKIIMLNSEFKQDIIMNQIKDIKNESSEQEKLSKCNSTNKEMLKIAEMEIKIMLNLKKWFDLMRTDAVNNNQVESYSEELKHIKSVILSLHVQRKTQNSIDSHEEKLLHKKRIKFSTKK